MSIRCDHCQAMNEDSAARCAQCGMELAAAAPESAGANPHDADAGGASDGTRCPACNQANAPGAKFCNACGAALADEAAAADSTVDQLKEEAAKLIEADQHEPVRAILEQALAIDPSRDDLRDMLRDVADEIRRRDINRMNQDAPGLIDQGQYGKAAEVLTEAMKLDPDNEERQKLLNETVDRPQQKDTASELVASAQRLMDVGRYKAAQVKLNEALRLAPNRDDIKAAIADLPGRITRGDLDGTLELAREAMDKRDFKAVLANCAKVLRLKPGHVEASEMKHRAADFQGDHMERLALVRSHVDSGRGDLALEVLSAVVKDYPWDPKAAAEFEDLTERQKKVSVLRRQSAQQASEYEQHGALNKALDTWIKLVKLRSDDEEAIANRDRLKKRLRCRLAVRTLAVLVALVLLGGGVYGAIEWLGGNQKLDQARVYIERYEFAAARDKLSECGWFAFQRDDVAAELTQAEFNWNIGQGAELATGPEADLAAAAKCYQRAAELIPGQRSAVEGLDTVKTIWLGSIIADRRAGEYDIAIAQGLLAVGLFPQDESFAKALAEARNIRSEMPLEWELDGAKLRFVSVPAGIFTMGSAVGQRTSADENPPRRVTMSRRFYMSATEITQGQYRSIMGSLPRDADGDDYPVRQVSWQDAEEFCRKLSTKMDRIVRLPTEAEWEYACRAGTTTPFHYGATISTEQANYDGKYVFGSGEKGLTRKAPVAVGKFAPNAWGLHDMHGNVQEWCADWYGAYTPGAVKDPAGPPTGDRRVLRGGDWYSAPWACRSASRQKELPTRSTPATGFRVVLELEASK